MNSKFSDMLATPMSSGLRAVIISIAICLSLSVFVRLHEYSVWKQNPASYFVDGTPMMTTVDAFYWVRLAREYKNGTYYATDGGTADKLRFFPTDSSKPARVPAISVLLAKLSGMFGDNLYIAGVYLIAVLSGFFIVPLILYFGRAGSLPAGILGSLVGTFSFIYLVRTSAARVDTDSLNLFFPFLASFFILLTHEHGGQLRPSRLVYLYCALAGLTMMLMELWYGISEFTYMYLAFLVVYLVIGKKGFKTTFFSALIFLYCSFPFSVNVAVFSVAALVLFFGYTYLFGGKKVKPAYAAIAVLVFVAAIAAFVYKSAYATSMLSGLIDSFSFIIKNYFTSDMGGKPSALTQVTELQHSSVAEVLAYVIKEPMISAIGLIGFIVFIIWNFKKAFPILPMFLIGLTAFHGANRFAMYLAPFIGAGFGYLITATALSLTGKLKDTTRKSVVYVTVIVFFVAIISQTAFFFIPQPALNVDYYRAFQDIKAKLHGKPVILTWWDFGYALEDITGFATFHDGGTQHTEKTLYIAHALTSASQPELYNITSFITGNGSTVTADDIIRDRAEDKPLDNVKNDNIYVLYTSDMIGKFPAMYNVRGIDMLRTSAESPVIQPLSCQSLKDDVLDCYEIKVDLKAGKINNATPLRKAVYVDNGYTVKSVEYEHNNGLYLELFASGKSINAIMVVNGVFFDSNLNQMYLLGKYDKSLFEEVYSALPQARLFRVKTPVIQPGDAEKKG
ncbi:STT3 domain-containing protein [Candidatus Magnetominusculus dajiuhuensis]|uniref:STT3 domain-containing protein n=1 Tax=Candidatus Magnetominusculus dajiuhuensis TaxID=3137712 RepID=UPI003B42FA3B